MTEPLIALLAGLALTGLVLVFAWPQVGLLARWRRTLHNSSQVLREDALKHIHELEMQGRRPDADSLAEALHVSSHDSGELLENLEKRELVQRQEGVLGLTPVGRETALHILRAHRLWEQYLADKTGYSALEWHDRAELLEHQTTPGEANALAAQLGYPTYDPHGDPIPDPDGGWVPQQGMTLFEAPIHQPLTIIHIEDEPQAVYAQILAEELHPGMQIRVTERSPVRVKFWAGGNEHVLAPVVSANITVRAVIPEADGVRLSQLKRGELAEVMAISPAVRGSERRRLLDLGLLPGTQVAAELVSPQGDPKAYRVRDALIALRAEQADRIFVRKLETYP